MFGLQERMVESGLGRLSGRAESHLELDAVALYGARRALHDFGREVVPELRPFQTCPFAHDDGIHHGVKEDVDGQETFVGAVALGLADPLAHLVGFLRLPDFHQNV